MIEWWQTLPQFIDPVAFSPFGFPIPWYTICYLLGVIFATIFFVSLLRRKGLVISEDGTIELIVSVLWGVIIGARLGYVLFYGDSSYWEEPWRIISPYDFTLGEWIGIRGLSFHGGLIGGAIGLWRFTREGNRDFWRIADALVQAVPIGILFGRLGNFLNHEIPGKITELAIGMQWFLEEGVLRHPVTLYEALAEGGLLFFFLVLVNRLQARSGNVTALFLIGYGVIRFVMEFFREVSIIQSLGITAGQALSTVLVLWGVLLLFRQSRQPLVVQ